MYTVLANPTHHIHHKSVHSPAGLKGSMACDSAVNTYSLTGPAAAFLPACAHKWQRYSQKLCIEWMACDSAVNTYSLTGPAAAFLPACAHKWHTDVVLACTHKWHTDEVRDCA